MKNGFPSVLPAMSCVSRGGASWPTNASISLDLGFSRPRSDSRVTAGSGGRSDSISAGCVRVNSFSRYVPTMQRGAALDARTTCRSRSNVGLSAQCRSSNMSIIGRTMAAWASSRRRLRTGRYRWPLDSWRLRREIRHPAQHLRNQRSKLSAAAKEATARASRLRAHAHVPARASTNGWYGTRLPRRIVPRAPSPPTRIARARIPTRGGSSRCPARPASRINDARRRSLASTPDPSARARGLVRRNRSGRWSGRAKETVGEAPR